MEKILSEPSQQPNNIADVIGNVTTKPKTSTCNTRKHGYSLPSVTSVRSSKTNAESINLSPKMEPRPHNENTSVLLFHLTDLPAWYKDAVNPYILSGYRQATYSYQRCIDSLFFLHNETGNIYSHLFGSLFFIYLMVSLHLQSISSITTLTTGDHLVLSTFLLGCVVCMGLSGGFHLFCCHSHEGRIIYY